MNFQGVTHQNQAARVTGASHQQQAQQEQVTTMDQQDLYQSRLFHSSQQHMSRQVSQVKESEMIYLTSSPPPTRLLKKPMFLSKTTSQVGIHPHRDQAVAGRLTINNTNYKHRGLQNERPFSQECLPPWQEDQKIEDTSESCPNEFGFSSEEDSCEANADERESMAANFDYDVGAVDGGGGGGTKDHERWDYFPAEEEDVEPIEDDFIMIGVPSAIAQGQFVSNGSQQPAYFSYERPPQLATVRKQKSQVELNRPNDASTFSPEALQERQGRMTGTSSIYYKTRTTINHNYNVSNNNARICELLRSKQAQPYFVKQSSKGSLDMNNRLGGAIGGVRGQNGSPRKTFYSPHQFRSNFILDMEQRIYRKRFTGDNTMWDSFAKNSKNAPGRNSSFAQDEKNVAMHQQKQVVQNRLSVQKLPTSRLSSHSQMMMMGDTRNRVRSPQSPPSTYQQQHRQQQQQVMAERSHFQYLPNKGTNHTKTTQPVADRRRDHQQSNAQQQVQILSSPEKNTRQQKQQRFTAYANNADIVDADFIQVEQNYFDHMHLPRQESGASLKSDGKGVGTTAMTPVIKRENLNSIRANQLNKSERSDKRVHLTSLLNQKMANATAAVASQSKRQKNPGNFDKLTEVNSAALIQQVLEKRTSFGEEISPTGIVPLDESPFKNLRGGADRTVFHLRPNMRHSQETENRSNVQDSSQRNLFSSFGRSNDGKKISVFEDGGISEEEDGDSLLQTAEKPIVPKYEYIRAEPEKIYEKQKVAADSDNKVGGDGAAGWFTSLSLSVSQMFSGGEPQPGDGDVADDEKRNRRPSSNGEVPIDEEEEEEKKNEDVIEEEETRVTGNRQSVRKRILFIEDGVTSKVKSTRSNDRSSQKKTLKSVQSYKPCESDSDLTDKDEEAFQSSSKQGENVISYATSKQDNDSPTLDRGRTINTINASKNFKKQRQHSSSVHELATIGGSIKKGWTNLTSSLMQSKLLEKQGIDTVNMASPLHPRMLHQGVAAADQDDEGSSNLEQSRLGMFGRFFERVTNTGQKDGAKSLIMSNNKNGREDKSEDYFSPQSNNDHSPLIADIKDFNQKESYDVKRELFGRPPSKTVYQPQRPKFLSLANQQTGPPQPDEKLKQIDKITFNQDRSTFAVIWTNGGFTKFDVATLQVVQTVLQVPPAQYSLSEGQDETEITLVSTDPEKVQSLGHSHMSRRGSRKRNSNRGEVQDDERFIFDDDDDELENAEKDQFTYVALQHRTQDYIASLVRSPNMVISVHIQDEKPINEKRRRAKKSVSHHQLGQRTQVKHFSEEVTQIEILPGARYTVICLKSKIYIYTKNSSTLYDIIDCSNPTIYSAIYKSYEDKLVLAYLNKDDSSETLQVHDYSISQTTGMDTIYTIAKPFSAGYKIGGVQLDELGQRAVVVSADGRFVYLYQLQEKIAEEEVTEPISQDMAAPEDGVSIASDAVSQDRLYYNQGLPQHHEVVIKAPQQQFARSASASQEIYSPIQFVEGFSIQDHSTDYILLSTCSMTTHLFALKTEEELAESNSQQKESWTFSQFLPSYYSLERSKIRLNIQEELMPPTPISKPNQKPDTTLSQSVAVGQHPEFEGQNVYKKHLQEYPYTCFVESSGLLVVISYSGYCCKFSIDLQNEEQKLHVRNSGFNSVRANRASPTRQTNFALANQKNLGQSLAMLTDQRQQIKRTLSNTARYYSRGGGHTSSDSKGVARGQEKSPEKIQVSLPKMSSVPQTTKDQHRKATAFSGYKHPTLRLKFKVKEFFVSIDQKAASLKRIHKRELLNKYNAEMRERAQFIAHLQKEQNRQQQIKSRQQKVSQLRHLLSTGSNGNTKAATIL